MYDNTQINSDLSWVHIGKITKLKLYQLIAISFPIDWFEKTKENYICNPLSASVASVAVQIN